MKSTYYALILSTSLIPNLAVAQGVAETPQMAPMALNSFTWSPDGINSVDVFDIEGVAIGRVQKLDLDQSGKPQGLEVAILGLTRVINVPAYNASYETQKKILIVGLNKAQLGQTPPSPR